MILIRVLVLYLVTGKISCMTINQPEIIIGSCAPNHVGEMVTELIARKIAYVPGEKCTPKNKADAVFNCNKQKLTTCNGGISNVLIQKSPIFSGFITSNIPYFLHSCNRNLTESIYRQYSAIVKPDEKKIEEYGKFVLTEIIEPILNKAAISLYPTFDEWLSRYTGKKLQKYQEAYQNYLEKMYVTEMDIRKMLLHSKTDEKVFVDYSSEKPKIKSRTVIEQLDEIKVLMGPLITFVSNCTKQTHDSYGSGLNYTERCEKFERWIEILGDYQVICIDGSAFDSTQWREIMLKIDTVLYTRVIDMHYATIMETCDPRIIKEIVKEYIIEVQSKICKFKQVGTVPSGKMSTSDGNTRRSDSYVRYAAYKANLVYGVHYFCECCGDDIIIFIKRDKTNILIESFREHVYLNENVNKKHGLGQIAKKFDVYDSIKDAEYLSCYFLINQNNKIKMIRKPERLFQLTPWTRSNDKRDIIKSKILNKELSLGDALEMLSWCGDIELYREYAKMLARFGGVYGIKEDIKSSLYSKKEDVRTDLRFNEEFIEMLKEKYNIDYGTYLSFIKLIKNIKPEEQYHRFRHEFIDFLFHKNSYTKINIINQMKYLTEYAKQGVNKINMNNTKFSIEAESRILDDMTNHVKENKKNDEIIIGNYKCISNKNDLNKMDIDEFPESMSTDEKLTILIDNGHIEEAKGIMYENF